MDISNDNYLEKLNERYGNLDGEILIIDLSRNQINKINSNQNKIISNVSNSRAKNANLGLSLAGNKDRSVYSVFVCGIHPQGLAGRDGRIKVGDELIEANGVQLLGRCHLNANAILQQLPGFHIKLVILRKTDAIKNMAVCPITQFPNDDLILNSDTEKKTFNSNSTNNLSEKFQKDIKRIFLKKNSEGLGILIKESNHPVLGKGIFVSEIQEGSIAENSGLKVGDMLVSVNQIQLLSIDYETALNLLKSMDGIILLNVIQTRYNEKYSNLKQKNLKMFNILSCLINGHQLLYHLVKYSYKSNKTKKNKRLTNILKQLDDFKLNKIYLDDIKDNQINLVSFVIVKDEKQNISYLKQISLSNLKSFSKEIKKELSFSEASLSTDQVLDILEKASKENCLKEFDCENILNKNLILSECDKNFETFIKEDFQKSIENDSLKKKSIEFSSTCSLSNMSKSMNKSSAKTEIEIDLENENDSKILDNIVIYKSDSINNETASLESKNDIFNENLLDSIDRVDNINKLGSLNNLLEEKTIEKSSDDETKSDLNTKNNDIEQDENNQSNDNQLVIKKNQTKTLDLKTASIYSGVETWIELTKTNNQVFGIYLIETSINNQCYVAIHEIHPEGVAAQDKRLNIGDIIIQINDICLKGLSSILANEHLNRTSGTVKLLVYRELICVRQTKVNEPIDEPDSIKKIQITYPLRQETSNELNESNKLIESEDQKIVEGKLYKLIDVELQRKSSKGLGFSICESYTSNKFIRFYLNEILSNSTAYLSNQFKIGDYLISINDQDISDFSLNSLSTLIKCQQGKIKIKLARLIPGKIMNVEQSETEENQKINLNDLQNKCLEANENENDNFNANSVKKNNEMEKTKTNNTVNPSLLNETIYNDFDKVYVEFPTMKNWVKIEKKEYTLNEAGSNSNNLKESKKNLSEKTKSNTSLKLMNRFEKFQKMQKSFLNTLSHPIQLVKK